MNLTTAELRSMGFSVKDGKAVPIAQGETRKARRPKRPPDYICVKFSGNRATIHALPVYSINSRWNRILANAWNRVFKDAGSEAAWKCNIHGVCRVTMTRFSPSTMDGDNLPGSLKPIRDGIARFAGVDDSEANGWEWIVKQVRCKAAEKRVEILFENFEEIE